MNGTKQQPKPKESTAPVGGSPDKENSILKTEVTTLKQRIEAMSKNIDDLSSMVQKVTLFSQNAPQTVNANNKRTKVEDPKQPIAACTPLPDEMLSSCVVSPNTTSMELDDLVPLPPSIPSPSPVERVTTTTSELSDEGFVDQLFTAFKTEDFEFDEAESVLPTPVHSVLPTPVHSVHQQQEIDMSDRPRPELMSRLSDALAVLPRDIQEMIVDRLIEAITSPKEIQDNITAANTLKEVGGMMMSNSGKGGKALPSAVPQSPKKTQDEHQQNNPLGLNLAAATLAALLSQYGSDNDTKPSSNGIKNSDLKALLIPVHA
jgi:heat shock transcription factor 2